MDLGWCRVISQKLQSGCDELCCALSFSKVARGAKKTFQRFRDEQIGDAHMSAVASSAYITCKTLQIAKCNKFP